MHKNTDINADALAIFISHFQRNLKSNFSLQKNHQAFFQFEMLKLSQECDLKTARSTLKSVDNHLNGSAFFVLAKWDSLLALNLKF